MEGHVEVVVSGCVQWRTENSYQMETRQWHYVGIMSVIVSHR